MFDNVTDDVKTPENVEPVQIDQRLVTKTFKRDEAPVPRSRSDLNEEHIDLGNSFIVESFNKLKKMLGLTPNCLNGGTKTLQSNCVCPKYYRGELCEELICMNNGTLTKIPNLVPVQYACRCPSPEFIQGTHCELIRCMNGGRPMDNGYCKCLDYWYTGQFCQEYTASWGAVLGLPLVCIVVIIICCVVCRLDLFPRKPARPRRNRRMTANRQNVGNRNRSGPNLRTCSRRNNDINYSLQDNLLSHGNSDAALILNETAVMPSYVIRLDTIPIFNPQQSSVISSTVSKVVGPPPSYEQAIATHLQNNGNRIGEPPEYSRYACK